MNDSIISNPCMACPYRRDVPSGIWSEEEYDKLPPYDRPTGEQPFEPFACHASPDKLCNGWARCHSMRGHEYELIALRLCGLGIDNLPESKIKLFASGQEAADHGKKDIRKIGKAAKIMIGRLIKRYGRFKEG